MRRLLVFLFLLTTASVFAQADNEIQVYASATVPQKQTIFELHSNYTFKGSRYLNDPRSARWLNEALEITHGVGKDFELGFYTFTGVAPGGRYQYLGSQIRPRITVPADWNWGLGASLSVEFGFFRPDDTTKFTWQGEIRPILDKTFDNWYFSLNPNVEFVLSAESKVLTITPQFKTVYTFREKFGLGFEYYGNLGSFTKLLPGKFQEHLIGPMIDLYIHPKWEINGGFLFGLTPNSNQHILKILLGRRVGK